MSTKPLVWIDVETTGLDPVHDQLLEIALIITNEDLEPHAAFHSVVHWDELPPMSEYVYRMHTENGLLEECRRGGLALTAIDDEIHDILERQAIDGYLPPLCGSSIHFDRNFVKRDLPRTHKMLHYRNIDVSSLKELILRWAPGKEYPKKEHHRALQDVHESIKALRYYRRMLGL